MLGHLQTCDKANTEELLLLCSAAAVPCMLLAVVNTIGLVLDILKILGLHRKINLH